LLVLVDISQAERPKRRMTGGGPAMLVKFLDAEV